MMENYGIAIGPDGHIYRTLPGESLGYGWREVSREDKHFFQHGKLRSIYWSMKRACDYDRYKQEEALLEPEILSFKEWMNSSVSRKFYSGDDVEAPINLLLWARYVARQCGASEKGPCQGFWRIKNDSGWTSVLPFQFQSPDQSMKFFSIVGEANLTEIRKLFT
jgi:hypothetical protein